MDDFPDSPLALHIQSAWRIRSGDTIIVGSDDYNYPSGDDPYRGHKDTELDTPGGNKRDELMASLLDMVGSGLRVESAMADAAGGFHLTLSNGFVLETFPISTVPHEYWRLIRVSDTSDHFVVTKEGIED